jgi:hypothetical protein
LGDGVKLNEITHVESVSLVGHFASRRIRRYDEILDRDSFSSNPQL